MRTLCDDKALKNEKCIKKELITVFIQNVVHKGNLNQYDQVPPKPLSLH